MVTSSRGYEIHTIRALDIAEMSDPYCNHGQCQRRFRDGELVAVDIYGDVSHVACVPALEGVES